MMVKNMIMIVRRKMNKIGKLSFMITVMMIIVMTTRVTTTQDLQTTRKMIVLESKQRTGWR